MNGTWRRRVLALTILAALAALGPACQSGRGIGGDAAVDEATDPAPDAHDDTGGDAGKDPALDPPTETAADPGADTPTDGGEDNCVVACLRAQWEGGRECERQMRDCYATCTSFSDETCTWDCEYDADMCWNDLTDVAMACGEACPCRVEYVECEEACAGSGDPACLDACDDAYDACTGYDWDGLRTCWDECYATLPNCLILCDPYEEADDPEGWGICYHDCKIESIDCHVDCL